MKNCPICRGYIFESDRAPHRCPPSWHVWDPEDCDAGDARDTRPIRAHSPGSAAEAYVNNGEWSDGDEVKVCVMSADPAAPEVFRFVVDVELTMNYSARPIVEEL